MKVRNSKGELKEIVIKANDSIPAGSVIDFEGDVVPEGYEKAEDEDWENLNEDYGCYYKMIGKQVFIRAVSEKNVTLKAFATNIIGTLPDKYKPAYQIRFNPYSRSYSTVYCEINTKGEVFLFNWDAEKTFEKGQIAFYINYYVD